MILTHNSPYPTLPVIKGEGRILIKPKGGKNHVSIIQSVTDYCRHLIVH